MGVIAEWPELEYPKKYELTEDEKQEVVESIGRFSLISAGLENKLRMLRPGKIRSMAKFILHPIQWSDESPEVDTCRRHMFFVNSMKMDGETVLEGRMSIDHFRGMTDLYDGFETARETAFGFRGSISPELYEITKLIRPTQPEQLPEEGSS